MGNISIRNADGLRVRNIADTAWLTVATVDGSDDAILGVSGEALRLIGASIAAEERLTIDADQASPLYIKTQTQNHGYVSFYTDSASQATRTAFIGYPSSGSPTLMQMKMERSNGTLQLNTVGSSSLVKVAIDNSERLQVSSSILKLTGLGAQLDNTKSVQGRNVANTAYLIMTKVTTGDVVELGGSTGAETKMYAGTTARIHCDATGIALFGGTPVAQASKINDPSGGATQDAEARTAINAVIDAIEGIGISASA